MTAVDLYFAPSLFVVLLIIGALIVVAAFWHYPSLRNYRRKRNLLLYAALVLVLILIIYLAYDNSLGTTYVTFATKKPQTPIYADHQNQFSLTTYFEGQRSVTFDIIFRCSNATFQVINQQDYIQLNETAIKLPFSFQGSISETRSICFTVDANVSSFSFYPSIERQGNNPDVAFGGLGEMQCQLDSATHSYAMADSTPFPIYPP